MRAFNESVPAGVNKLEASHRGGPVVCTVPGPRISEEMTVLSRSGDTDVAVPRISEEIS